MAYFLSYLCSVILDGGIRTASPATGIGKARGGLADTLSSQNAKI